MDKLFEILMVLISSGIFITVIKSSFKLGSFHKEVQLNFKHVDERFINIDKRFENIETDIREIRKDISRIDKDVAVITATLKFNGYELQRHKAEGE